jgi:predicted HAD superfamily Cof-like phosphohydrolase
MFEDMIRDFQRRQGVQIGSQGPFRTLVGADEKLLRLRLIASELGELADAMGIDDRVEIADALADLLYVIIGTGVMYNIPVLECLAEVHSSNMTKDALAERAPGQKGGIKGASYRPPNLKKILDRCQELYDQRHAQSSARASQD